MIKYQPVMPSSILQERTDSDFNYSEKISNNMTLKVGVVIDIIELEDKRNKSKVTTEYSVMTIEQQTNNTYGNCMAVDGFGGVSDFFEKKLRKTRDTVKINSKSAFDKQNGSIVLLLCIDGHSEQAIIIGAIAHPDRKNGKLTKAKGHHLEGEFNGINWQIDKDGALTVKFKTASDNDGKYKDEKAGGATIKMEKDGSIEAADGNKEKIRIDKTKKTIDIIAEKDISATTDENVNITAKKAINAKATADLLADAGGSMTLKSASAFNIDAGAAMEVKAASVNLVSDGSIKLKGTTVQIAAPVIQLGDGGSPAVILTTQVLAVGNLGAPTIGTMIGPFSSTVFVAP